MPDAEWTVVLDGASGVKELWSSDSLEEADRVADRVSRAQKSVWEKMASPTNDLEWRATRNASAVCVLRADGSRHVEYPLRHR